MNSGVAGGLLRHQAQRLVVKEAVGLDIFGAEIVGVVEMLDAGGGLETARAHEGAKGRIERQRIVAAAAQRQRQPALDPAGRDAGHEIGKAAERTRRKPGEHIVFGEPARAAIALGEEFALLAVERLEIAAVALGTLMLPASRMSKLDSSWIMMMLGRRPAGWQDPAAAR